MTNITRTQPDAVEAALVDGDLSRLTVQERIAYYTRTRESLGLNPLTKPFAYLKLNGRLVLYPLRDCTDQLRKLNRVSITIASRETVGDSQLKHGDHTAHLAEARAKLGIVERDAKRSKASSKSKTSNTSSKSKGGAS